MKGTQAEPGMDLKGIILSGKEKKRITKRNTLCNPHLCTISSQSDQIIENRSKVSRG